MIEQVECEDDIPDLVTCSTNPLTGQPSTCADIPSAAQYYGIAISTICKSPIAQIQCSGAGLVEEYCLKTCSACSKYVFG